MKDDLLFAMHELPVVHAESVNADSKAALQDHGEGRDYELVALIDVSQFRRFGAVSAEPQTKRIEDRVLLPPCSNGFRRRHRQNLRVGNRHALTRCLCCSAFSTDTGQ